MKNNQHEKHNSPFFSLSLSDVIQKYQYLRLLPIIAFPGFDNIENKKVTRRITQQSERDLKKRNPARKSVDEWTPFILIQGRFLS